MRGGDGDVARRGSSGGRSTVTRVTQPEPSHAAVGRYRVGLRARVTAVFAALAFLLSTTLAIASYELTRSFLLDRREAAARQEAYLNARAVRDALRVNSVDVGGALAPGRDRHRQRRRGAGRHPVVRDLGRRRARRRPGVAAEDGRRRVRRNAEHQVRVGTQHRRRRAAAGGERSVLRVHLGQGGRPDAEPPGPRPGRGGVRRDADRRGRRLVRERARCCGRSGAWRSRPAASRKVRSTSSSTPRATATSSRSSTRSTGWSVRSGPGSSARRGSRPT